MKRFVTFLALVPLLLLVTGEISNARAASSCPNGTTMNIVAHEDDDLLFLSPDVLHDIQNGRCVVGVFMTAGDDGLGSAYWQTRENGPKAAYANMSGAVDSWSESDAGVANHPIPVFTLNGNSLVSLAFMRLPDGATNGSGFAINNNESLQKIWQTQISTIHTVDGSSSYSKQDIADTLTALMNIYNPDKIRTQDFVGSYGDGDHSDHHAAAYFAQLGIQKYVNPATLVGYVGYPSSSNPVNVSGSDATAKESAFFAYALYDQLACQTLAECQQGSYGNWFVRQYVAGVVSPPTNVDIAPAATVTASSESPQTSQLAVKAVDGVVDGYPGDYTREWATSGQKAGAWLNLTWNSSQTISQVVLYDRPNLDDQITSGTLTFSDGSTISVGTLNNNGSAVTLNFSPRSVTSVRFDITGVSSATKNIGLSEIQVFGQGQNGPTPTPTPVVTATPTPTSNPTPTPTSAPQPTPTPTPGPAANNIAPSATVTASSENPQTSQLAVKAVDGVVDGYPGDYTKEWATVGQKAGAWLNLVWNTQQTVSQVVLYDRPNLDDQITSGTLTFSDGSTVSTGTLANNGTATTINFSPRSITSVRLDVTGVSGTTKNIGLSEIQIFSQSGPTPTPSPIPSGIPTPTPSPTPSPTPPPVTPTPTSVPQPTPTPTPGPAANNIAPSATVTASSENPQTSQLAVKAVDGVVDGYPGDYTKEWATVGQKAGAWLNLVWNTQQTVSQVVLYDRPNLDDQITSGTLTFSDGSTVSVGALNNNGSAVTLNFSSRSVTSVRLDITGVSSSTKNIGLSEVQVF